MTIIMTTTIIIIIIIIITIITIIAIITNTSLLPLLFFGSFIVVAHTHHDFARAIRKKLILEIAGKTPSHWDNPPKSRIQRASTERVAPACDSGEKRRELYWNEADDY